MDWTSDNKQFEGLKIKPQKTNITNIDTNPKFQGIVVNKDDTIEEKKTTAEIVKTIDTSLKERGDMTNNEFINKDELQNLEEKMDLKIKVAIQPVEGKIDNLSTQISNLPTQFENMLLKERQHQDDRRKETQRYIWGTIIIGLVSIAISVILHFF